MSMVNPTQKSTIKSTIIIHDTDLHGLTCGITALYALEGAIPLSHFDPRSELRTTPDNLANVIQNLGNADLYVLDIPIDVRNPKAYIDALIAHVQFKGRVVWMDHHGHSQWVDVLNRNGVFAVVFGTSYDLTMALPRMFSRVDSFVEGWAIIGALADFDPSIAPRVSRDLEEVVCDIVDSVYKQQRQQLMQVLNINEIPQYGNIGSISYGIATRRIEASQFIEACKSIGRPIPLPRTYGTLTNVVYTTEIPQSGLAWKTAWKLCLTTGCKVAMVPTYIPQRNQYSLIIATYWREDDRVRQAVEEFITMKFPGRQVVGHFGARSILLMAQNELEMIPQWARELDELISQRCYTPRTARLISDEYVARAIHEDYNRIVQLLERIAKALEAGAEAKQRQVELLKELYEKDQRTRYD